MSVMVQWIAILGLSASVLAQTRTAPGKSPAHLEGQVLRDTDETPLRRAQVFLRPMEAGLTAVGVETDDRGNFEVRNIQPGRYTLLAQRDGYLSTSVGMHGASRMPSVIEIGSGQDLANVTFYMRPWAVLAGRVKYDDAEPAIGIRVDAYREYRAKGRHGYAVVTSAFTDDRGEYRMHGLLPGAYLIAASYEKSPPAPGFEEQRRKDAEGRELPFMAYTTTFYPDTTKLTEAVPLELQYGKELAGVDLFLQRVRKVTLRGRVISGVSGQIVTSASITLQRRDSHNSAVLSAPARASFDRQGYFEIKDVTPGSYVVDTDSTESGMRLTGRKLLTLGAEDVVNLELMVSAEQPWRAEVRIEGGGKLQHPRALRASLEPRSERAGTVTADVDLPGFRCTVRGDETYDVYVQNLPEDFYLSAVRVNGTDVLGIGLEGALASVDHPFEVVLDSRGGRVAGQVIGPDGEVWSGANLMLVPDPPSGHLQAYREGSADEQGQFKIRGVAPGKYTLIAWLDDPPCDPYDPDGLSECRAAGMPITVAPAAGQSVIFTVKPASKR